MQTCGGLFTSRLYSTREGIAVFRGSDLRRRSRRSEIAVVLAPSRCGRSWLKAVRRVGAGGLDPTLKPPRRAPREEASVGASMSLLVSPSSAPARPDLQSWSPRNVLKATLAFLLAIDDAATLCALHRDVVLDGGVTLLSPVLPPVGAPIEFVVAREVTVPMFVRVAWSPAARAAFGRWVDTGVGPAAPPAPTVGRVVVADAGRRAPATVRLVDDDDTIIDLPTPTPTTSTPPSLRARSPSTRPRATPSSLHRRTVGVVRGPRRHQTGPRLTAPRPAGTCRDRIWDHGP
jgi:hypothetical protein